MIRPLALLNSMSNDQLCEVVDLVSLLRVRDLIRECGRQRREQERRKGLDPETWERLRKLMPPPREDERQEPVAGPRRLDLDSQDPSTASDQFGPQRA